MVRDQWLSRRREQAGLSIRALAKASGVDERSLYRIEQQNPGTRRDPKTIRSLAAPLQIAPAAITFLLSDPNARDGDHFDEDVLDEMAGPVTAAVAEPEEPEGELRAELDRLREFIAGVASIVADAGRRAESLRAAMLRE